MQINIIALFLIFAQFVRATDQKDRNSDLSIFDDKFVLIIGDVTNYVTKILEDYNDVRLGKSEWGSILGYEEMKPKLLENGKGGRGLKKMSMALMPLIFHVGAASTWMVLTSIMAVKSVAIGLILLVFKIAVSSAKVASFFTHLKSMHPQHHESWSWSPPHGHDRSFSHDEIPVHEAWNSISPEWASDTNGGYKPVPLYKGNDVSPPYEVEGYIDESKSKSDKKYG